MKVQKINWIDKSALEATVLVTDGVFDCEVFCCPCKLSVGDNLTSPLYSLSENNIVRIENRLPSLVKKHNWSYEIVGEIIDIDKRLIRVGGIEILLGPMPGDLKNGDTVHFYSSRLDVLD